CGGTQPKKESSMVSEGSDSTPDCCCKTIPQTAEKEIIPVYAMKGRMECSADHGDCMPDVQCNGQQKGSPEEAKPAPEKPANDGVAPPPTLGPNGAGDAVPRR